MTPKSRYQAELDSGTLTPDAEQASIVDRLDALSVEIANADAWAPKPASVVSRWFGRSKHGEGSTVAHHGPKGLYLWGGVGRGKTHLCDLFFDAVPIAEKKRLHFHRFMQRIHDDLRALGEIENPLQTVADRWAADSRLLLLDEMHVNDITDAMLLGGLCSELFDRGVTLVTTSNVPPDGLYRDGLQRARFIPAIERIKSHTNVIEMVGETDYRLRILQTEAIYLVKAAEADAAVETGEYGKSGKCEPDNSKGSESVDELMQQHFDRLAFGARDTRNTINVNQRDIPLLGRAGDVVWFDFKALCATARSTHDYIEIATLFHTVLISNVPMMDDTKNDEARRFVNLVDEFYDRCVKLIVSADAPPDGLYTGKRLSFEFERSASRLTEMQTTEYLAKREGSASLGGA